MMDENVKSFLSGTKDEDGLLLKTQITAFVYDTYEEIEDSLFNFIDELQLLPLDITSLLQIEVGDAHHKLDSLKELNSVTEKFDLISLQTADPFTGWYLYTSAFLLFFDNSLTKNGIVVLWVLVIEINEIYFNVLF